MDDNKDTFTRVERHLYKHQHRTKLGEWSTRYYAVFNDWKGIPRRIPLSDQLDRARNKLGELERKNDGEFDFDAERRQREEEAEAKEKAAVRGITFREWGERYLKVMAPGLGKREGGIEREEYSFKKLLPFFGDMALYEITRTKAMEYRTRRSQEMVIRDGKERPVSTTTANRELSFLRYLLNLAEEDELIEVAPRIKLLSEAGRQRTKTVSPEEYRAILANMERVQQRYVICLHETAMRLNEPRRLTWDKVDLRKGVLHLAAVDVKENFPRTTPVSWELRQVLEELKAEQRKIPNVGNFVFTRQNGQPIVSIRTAWGLALERAKLNDLVPHDLRRTAISRWTALGIPRDVVMRASGHKPNGVHDYYISFSEEQLVDAFRALMLPPAERAKVAAAR